MLVVLLRPHSDIDVGCSVEALWFSCSQRFFNYFAFKYFGFERTWWRLFQKRIVRTNFDIYVFCSINLTLLYILTDPLDCRSPWKVSSVSSSSELCIIRSCPVMFIKIAWLYSYFRDWFSQNFSNLPSDDLLVGAVTAEDGRLFQVSTVLWVN